MPNARVARHGQLTGGAVTTVTIQDASYAIEVINRTGTDEIYWTASSSGGTPPDPTIGGDDCFVVPALLGSYVASTGSAPVTVKLLSNSGQKFSVVAGEPV